MPVIDLQRAVAEIGRIRIGQLVPGTKRPTKLDTFRLTSADKRPIVAAAELYGGKVEPWEAPAGPQWQVVTETAELAVIVPPSDMAFSQYLELWSGGGCLRRCDSATELLTEQPCLCDPEKRECEYHTRLSVMIRDLPGLGVWRLDTQGWYAARELAGAVEIIRLAAGHGILLPARLLVEQRSVKRIGPNGKPVTLRFPVPRLDPGITPGELLAGQTNGISLQIAAETRPPLLTPVPQITAPGPSIAEQSAPPAARPPRRNAAPALPSSGRRRAEPEPAEAPTALRKPGDDGYWRARAFADGAERNVGPDQMRAIAAMRAGAELDGFSMSGLSESDWEQVHRIVVGFPIIDGTEEPESVAGFVIDGSATTVEAPGAAEDPAPLSTSTPQADVAPAAAPVATDDGDEQPGLSRDDLVAELRTLGISTGIAAVKSKEMWPDRGAVPLTDAQRLELLTTLRQEQAVAAGL